MALKPSRKDTVINPLLIGEVLSDSTESYCLGDKFEKYRTIPTFQEYLLIHQHQPHIEQFVKQSDGEWLFTEHKGSLMKVNLVSVPVDLALKDLYS